MEDRQIIELYWNRSDDAIKETAKKYDEICTYIVGQVLKDEVLTETCVKECYTRLWETIPPHKPRNLKAYLCKISRKHALQMKYPDGEGQETDLFRAELVIQDFVKGLEETQRKVFLAHYWYLASVEEITQQYQMSAGKVQKTLEFLRQSLQEQLTQKNIVFDTEAALLYAMTEMDDRYLEEAMPAQKQSVYQLSEYVGDDNPNTDFIAHIKNYMTPSRIKAVAAIAASVVVLIICILLPNDFGKTPQNGSELAGNSQETEHSEETENTQNVPPVTENVDTDILEFINILRGDWLDKDTFEERRLAWPWKTHMAITALPIYKNLMYGYGGETIYYDEDTLRTIADKYASKLNMQEISTRVNKSSQVGLKNMVTSLDMTTDTGSIQVDGNGKVTISFLDGVQLPASYTISDDATTEEANATVTYLLQLYKELLPEGEFTADCYAEYDYYGTRTMNYRAVEKTYDAEGITDYYFNQITFGLQNQMGLTEISFGDMRVATELMGYYPIISFDEAVQLLQEGKAVADDEAGASHPVKNNPSFAAVRAVELKYMYGNDMVHYYHDYEYYQPYYCFYVELETANEYCRYYVPAVKGVGEDGTPPQMDVTILNMSEYEKLDNDIYYKDGKPYTFKNGEIVEAKDHDGSEDPYYEYGEVSGEYKEDGTVEWILYYKGDEILNLTRLNMPPDGSGNNSLDAMYIDGQVVVFSILYPNSDSTQPVATGYLYSEEDKSLTPIIFSVPLYGPYQPQGLNKSYGRYGTMGESGEVLIVDLLTGRSINTGIFYENVQCILSASDKYFAFVNKEGEIALIAKKSGKLFKKASYKLSFTPSQITYQDDMLYIPGDSDLIFVIKDFES